MFSRVAKQGLLALGRENDETHCSGSEKNALSVVAVGTMSQKKRQTDMAGGTKPVTSKQMGEVKKQRGPVSRKIYNNTKFNTVGLEKVVLPVPPRKVKEPTIFIEPMNEVAVAPISDDPRNKRVSRTGNGRLKARRVVTPGRMH